MTPTGPTPAPEPHQREDEREALVALARVLVEDAGFDHDDASDMAERLLAVWPDERRTVDLTAVAKGIATERQAAHLAARQPARVEAVAKVLAEHPSMEFEQRGDEWAHRCTGCGETLFGHDRAAGFTAFAGVSFGVSALAHHQAAQIAALAPEPGPGVSAEQVEAATAAYVKCRRGATGKVNNWDRAAMLDALAALGIEVRDGE